ncbi:MAG: hypothetical protein OEZ22_03025 [Spirochaetia bacterium]|nr:hypothetical protein [Spirochaetia bacterium]
MNYNKKSNNNYRKKKRFKKKSIIFVVFIQLILMSYLAIWAVKSKNSERVIVKKLENSVLNFRKIQFELEDLITEKRSIENSIIKNNNLLEKENKNNFVKFQNSDTKLTNNIIKERDKLRKKLKELESKFSVVKSKLENKLVEVENLSAKLKFIRNENSINNIIPRSFDNDNHASKNLEDSNKIPTEEINKLKTISENTNSEKFSKDQEPDIVTEVTNENEIATETTSQDDEDTELSSKTEQIEDREPDTETEVTSENEIDTETTSQDGEGAELLSKTEQIEDQEPDTETEVTSENELDTETTSQDDEDTELSSKTEQIEDREPDTETEVTSENEIDTETEKLEDENTDLTETDSEDSETFVEKNNISEATGKPVKEENQASAFSDQEIIKIKEEIETARTEALEQNNQINQLSSMIEMLQDKLFINLVTAKTENISFASHYDYDVLKDKDYHKAKEHMKMGDYQQASLYFQKSIQNNPNSTIPLTGLSRSLYKEKKISEAKIVFNRYIEKLLEINKKKTNN